MYMACGVLVPEQATGDRYAPCMVCAAVTRGLGGLGVEKMGAPGHPLGWPPRSAPSCRFFGWRHSCPNRVSEGREGKDRHQDKRAPLHMALNRRFLQSLAQAGSSSTQQFPGPDMGCRSS